MKYLGKIVLYGLVGISIIGLVIDYFFSNLLGFPIAPISMIGTIITMILEKEVSLSYKKRELDYKNNLDKIGREEESKYKKTLSNYSLYNEKKHTIYANLS